MDKAELKSRAALASVGASAALTLGKLVAGLLSGSLALLSEALHSLLDTGATIITWFAVRAADRPADDEHHYGHGKIEAVAALAETGLLAALAVFVLVEATRRLVLGEPAVVEATWLAYGVLVVSIVVDLVRWRSLAAIAKETKSEALAADALHFSSDLVASSLVLAGLVATQFGFSQGDSLAAIGVAVFIAIAGWRLARRTIDTLVDKAPDGVTASLRETLLAVPGVAALEELRLRPAGGSVIGEATVSVARTLPVERIMAVKREVLDAIARSHPEAAITVTANSRSLDDETVMERVLMAAARRHLPVHHVTVQGIGDRKAIGLDLEVDGRMSMADAHEIASHLESAIRDELGPDVEVDTHIEPMHISELAGQDADEAVAAPIREALEGLAAAQDDLEDIHDVRVRATDLGLVVNYHCRVAPTRSVEAAHADVDRLEHALRQAFPAVVRVVGHAEPSVS